MQDQKRIAIVGAGPGGLTLARILRIHGITANVFERDEHSASRSQGGSLDMHAESGRFAIECAGLSAEFEQIARYQDQETRIYDKHGNLLFEDTDCSSDRPEVDRTQLRQMLLDSLPDSLIRWNHSLRGIEQQTNGTFSLAFQTGKTEEFDLVVGADGAWSRIRPLVSDAAPIYSGVTFMELNFDDADKRHPEISALVGHGMMFALGDSKALLGHRNANGHVGIYAGLRVPENWIESGNIDMSSSDAIKNSLVAHFEDWSESFRQIFHRCNNRMAPRPIYYLPIGHRWKNKPGATLIGDAAHLMSPFSGEGANLAMLDAADLALALATEQDWEAAIQRFELKMVARAESAAIEAYDNLNETFSEQGPEHLFHQMSAQSG